MKTKVTPYNTGKVMIGINYAPPCRGVELSIEEVALQAALLGSPPHSSAQFSVGQLLMFSVVAYLFVAYCILKTLTY